MWIPQWSQFDGDDPTSLLAKTKFWVDVDQIKMSIVISVPNFLNKFIPAAKAFVVPSGGCASSELFSAKVTSS